MNLLRELVSRTLLTAEQAERVGSLAAEDSHTPIRLLIREGLVDQQVLAVELSRFHGVRRRRTGGR